MIRVPFGVIEQQPTKIDSIGPNALDLAIDMYEQIIEVVGLLQVEERKAFQQMKKSRSVI